MTWATCETCGHGAEVGSFCPLRLTCDTCGASSGEQCHSVRHAAGELDLQLFHNARYASAERVSNPLLLTAGGAS